MRSHSRDVGFTASNTDDVRCWAHNDLRKLRAHGLREMDGSTQWSRARSDARSKARSQSGGLGHKHTQRFTESSARVTDSMSTVSSFTRTTTRRRRTEQEASRQHAQEQRNAAHATRKQKAMTRERTADWASWARGRQVRAPASSRCGRARKGFGPRARHVQRNFTARSHSKN